MRIAREVTQLLEFWTRGDPTALDQVMELIYEDLSRLADSQLRRERREHTLETSALVNEAFLRLVAQRKVRWQSRAHFFGIAARMMRRILINYARNRSCAKRGGGVEHLPLSDAESTPVADERLAQYMAVGEAVQSLASVHPEPAEIVELSYFGGLSRKEIAEALGISVPTVSRRLRIARAWLYRYLEDVQGEREESPDERGQPD